MRIKDVIFNLYKSSSKLVGWLIPIDDNLIMFDSYPDYSDNSRALSDYLALETNYKIIWAVNNPNKYKSSDRINFIGKKGFWNRLRYTFYSKRAIYLFSTHGAFPEALSKKQIFVCLWHGSPLKKIARMQNPYGNLHYMENCKYFISPSEIYVNIFAKSFGRTSRDILLTGYPRNDFLYQKTDCLERLGVTNSSSKIIAYLPTFRQPKGGGYSDSSKNIFEESIIKFSNHDELLEWNEFFKQNNIILIVKPHPSDSSFPLNKSLSNIRIIKHEELTSKDIQLYHLLYFADALITDYSSVFCDYLTLDRPIAFILDDIEEYSTNRGFVFENPLDCLPGYKVYNQKDLKEFIADISNSVDKTKSLRLSVTGLYLKYKGNGNCERLWTTIKNLK